MGDRGFESCSLHQRVSCEPDSLDQYERGAEERTPGKNYASGRWGRRARGGQQAPTVSLNNAILKAVQAHGEGAAATEVLNYLSQEFGMTVRPNLP
jgi:hypothetical protein